jgi:hypothetical protein
MRDSGGLWRGGLAVSGNSNGSVKSALDVSANRNDGDVDVRVNGDSTTSTPSLSLSPGGLWLAGEHVAPFVALGTTTGAYWSGEGVARRVCGKWGVNIVEDEGGEDGGEG